MTRPRMYCCTYGCFNSMVVTPELSYFKLPTDVERRTIWLHLIARDDLLNASAEGITVCEMHFGSHQILSGSQRKTLKKDALPEKRLPKVDKSTQLVTVYSVGSQTPKEFYYKEYYFSVPEPEPGSRRKTLKEDPLTSIRLPMIIRKMKTSLPKVDKSIHVLMKYVTLRSMGTQTPKEFFTAPAGAGKREQNLAGEIPDLSFLPVFDPLYLVDLKSALERMNLQAFTPRQRIRKVCALVPNTQLILFAITMLLISSYRFFS